MVMKRICFEVKCRWTLWLLTGLMIVSARAQTLPHDPTPKWVPVPYPTNVVSDYINDQQTGSAEGDIVGTNGLSATYTAFNFGTSPTNGLQGHRVRVGADA